MTSGTKILLALIGLFVGILVLYYGFLMPGTPPGGGGLVRDPVLEKGPAVVSTPPALSAAERPAETPAPPPATKVTARQVMPIAAAETGSIERTTEPTRSLARTAGEAATVAGALGGATQPRRDPARAGAGGPTKNAPRESAGAPVRSAAPARTPVPAPGSSAGSSRGSAAPVTATSYTRYVVEDGDTLTSIAQRWFGDHRKWDLIAETNDIDPNRLKVGQVLRLPARGSARTPVRREPRSGVTTHTIRAGDSLSSLAQAYYGNRGLWKRIYAANRDLLGGDPDTLEVGMRLRIP